MDPRVLVTEQKYEGKYVALRSFTDNTIVAYGKRPHKVINKAVQKGVAEPVIVFVPKPIPKHDIACIY